MTASHKRNTTGLHPRPTGSFGPRKMVTQRWPLSMIDRVAGAAEKDGISATEWTLRVLLGRLEELELPTVEYLLPEEVEGCRHPTDALRQMGEMRRCGVCGDRV